MSDWFARWFGEEYLELYPHRDEEEARHAAALVRNIIGPVDVSPILDLACGSGRHSRALRDWAWTVGFDLSAPLLKIAEHETPGAPYVRGDMRALPFADHAFGLVVNLFTSFGYFDTDAQHLRVLAEVARVTRRGGVFVMDYFNADEVRRTLTPSSETEINGRIVRQHRAISSDGRYVEKQISATDCDSTFTERVRLFTKDDLIMMFEESGFGITRVLGNYDGTNWEPRSPRVLIFAERE